MVLMSRASFESLTSKRRRRSQSMPFRYATPLRHLLERKNQGFAADADRAEC